MEPIPETSEAVDEFGPFHDDDLLDELQRRSVLVQRVVPSCVGLSLASRRAGVTFTLVASSAEIALLDAVQYVDDGPCVAAVDSDRVLEYAHPDLLDEAGWALFARATAGSNVATTLTLPIVAAGAVTGSINLYAATPGAFSGHHTEIARIFDAWAPGAVVNADLPFSTRQVAEQAPGKLRGEYSIAVATGFLAEDRGTGEDEAREGLRQAAIRAGVTEAQLADVLISLRRLTQDD